MPSQRKEQHLASSNNGHYTRRIHNHVFAQIGSRVDSWIAFQGIICDDLASNPIPGRHSTTRWPRLDASIPAQQRDRTPRPRRRADRSSERYPIGSLPDMAVKIIDLCVHSSARAKGIIRIRKRDGPRQANFAKCRNDLTAIPAQFQLPDIFRCNRMIHSHQAGKIAGYRWSDLNFRHNLLCYSRITRNVALWSSDP